MECTKPYWYSNHIAESRGCASYGPVPRDWRCSMAGKAEVEERIHSLMSTQDYVGQHVYGAVASRCHLLPTHALCLMIIIIIIMIIIIMIIIIALKDTIRDFFTVSSLRRAASPTRTLKWPGCNRVQITCNTSSAYHVQLVLRATWFEGTAQLLSLTELKLHLFELYFIG